MSGQDSLLKDLLNEHKDLFGNILENLNKYEAQIIYTQIDRDKNNFPHFNTHTFNVDKNFYYYPASTVKFPASVVALEKLNKLNIHGLNKFTPLKIDSAYEGQSKVAVDPSSENGLPSIGHYIKKILLVSNNDAFNRIYEFDGQKYLNETLWEKGYKNLRIAHRLEVARDPESNKYTNPFTFYNGDKIIYHQDLQYNPDNYDSLFNLKNTLRGKGYIAGGKLVEEPMDFSKSNYVSLEDHTNILKAVLFPEAVPEEKRFDLSDNDYQFLYKYMSMLPKESKYPNYNDGKHYDSYVKLLMFGNSKDPMPENIRIFNKTGTAYGFLIDIAYIVDFENNIEFMLSAIIHVNENQIFNDDNYEYEKIGEPFFANLGNTIYNYELNRKREFAPDLSKFKIDYSEQEEK